MPRSNQGSGCAVQNRLTTGTLEKARNSRPPRAISGQAGKDTSGLVPYEQASWFVVLELKGRERSVQVELHDFMRQLDEFLPQIGIYRAHQVNNNGLPELLDIAGIGKRIEFAHVIGE